MISPSWDKLVKKVCDTGDVEKMQRLLDIQTKLIEEQFKTMPTIHALYGVRFGFSGEKK